MSPTPVQDEWQQAGPLPPKRGEIEYREDLHGQAQQPDTSSANVQPLPPRHPADRDPLPPRTALPDDSTNPVPSSASPLVTTANDNHDASSSHSCKKLTLISFLKNGKNTVYFGIRLITFFILALHLSFLTVTITVWVVTALHFSDTASSGQSPTPSPPSAPSSSGNTGMSMGIFLHVIFAVLVLGQLIFLERRIYRIRIERYMHKHPSQSLPTHSRHASSVISFAPWNRPPLPTYAATLAQSGVGTGDVEDHLIAAPPPPAYGNTRGSTLLLAGALRDSLRLQDQQPHRRSSQRSQRSQRQSVPTSRPVSYHTTDEHWEMRYEQDRTRRLEETLASLERPRSRTQRAGVV